MAKGLFTMVTGRRLRIIALAALLGGVPVSANADLVLETVENLEIPLYGISGFTDAFPLIYSVQGTQDGNNHAQDAIAANNALKKDNGLGGTTKLFTQGVHEVGKIDDFNGNGVTVSAFDIGTITLTCLAPSSECTSLTWEFDINPNATRNWRIVKIGVKASTDLAYYLVTDQDGDGNELGTITGIGALSGTIDIGSIGFSDELFRNNGGIPQAISYLEFFGSPIPEPGTLALFAIGLAALGSIRRRRKSA